MVAFNDPQATRGCALLEEIAVAAENLLNLGPREDGDAGLEKVARSAAIIDGALGVCALIRSNGQSHAPTVARSLMELLGDIYWLCQSPQYFYRLQLTASRRVRCDATDFIRVNRHNPIFVRNIDQQREMARWEKQKITTLLKEFPGLKALGVGERVAAPGLPPAVEYIYGIFSKEAHHDAFAIRQRMQGMGPVKIGDTLTISQVLRTLGLTGLIVVAAMEQFPRFVSIPSEVAMTRIEFAQGLSQALAAMWSIVDPPRATPNQTPNEKL